MNIKTIRSDRTIHHFHTTKDTHNELLVLPLLCLASSLCVEHRAATLATAGSLTTTTTTTGGRPAQSQGYRRIMVTSPLTARLPAPPPTKVAFRRVIPHNEDADEEYCQPRQDLSALTRLTPKYTNTEKYMDSYSPHLIIIISLTSIIKSECDWPHQQPNTRVNHRELRDHASEVPTRHLVTLQRRQKSQQQQSTNRT